MSKTIANRKLGALGILAALALLWAAPARGEAPKPLFQYYGAAKSDEEEKQLKPFPPQAFEGACGVAVDAKSNFYVSDYYHRAVDALSSARHYLTQVAKEDPEDGPCGLAIDAAGALYVNNYHRNVVRFTPAAFPIGSGAAYGPGVVIDEHEPTGVAVDPASGRVYVDDRTYIAVYEPSGAPVLDGEGHPLHIGEETLQDGYGIAVSAFEGTAGDLYVPDAGSDTVKVYDPATSPSAPIEIDGHEDPSGGFVSLRDSAIAVDRKSGQIYVADLLLPQGYERPEAAIYAFNADGAYAGRLKYNVIDALPPGLAVDNTNSISLSRVYVTTGNSAGASVYAYGPGSASTQLGACAPEGPCPARVSEALVGASAASGRAGKGAVGSEAAAAGGGQPRARASSTLVQRGTLRVKSQGSISPERLPRKGLAPIAVSVAGQISTTDGGEPPQLEALRIEINRHGHLDATGLPTCPYAKIATASSQRAMRACESALVGKGSFTANIVLSGQEPYPTEGKLLVFNGEKHGKPVLYGQIYAARPFATSFVIVFSISKIAHGTYGAALSADLPRALGNWGYLTGIKMRLSRRYGYEGKSHSFLSAGCPAPEGVDKASFSLVRTTFSFAGVGKLGSTLTQECGVKG